MLFSHWDTFSLTGVEMELSIKFKTDNAAFEDGAEYEAGRILNELVEKIEMGYRTGAVYDYNGNSVGEWSWK
jgi:hypothetical protein